MATKTGTYRRDVLSGAELSDTLIGLGGNDSLTGNDGADFLYGDAKAYASSEPGGNDRLSGGAGDDFLAGGAGDDILLGGDGNDRLVGGYGISESQGTFGYVSGQDGGNDTYVGGDGFDEAILFLNRPDDLVVSIADPRAKATITASGAVTGTINSVEQIQVFAGDGDDHLTGGGFYDVLAGRAGSDVLSGGDGPDRLEGGLGDDRLDGGNGSDTISLIEATSGVTVDLRIQGVAQDTGEGLDTLISVEGVYGSGFSDRLIGTAGNDILNGSYGGSDRLSGGDGDDDLTVSAGYPYTRVRDVLEGGDGNDAALISVDGLEGSFVRFDAGRGDDRALIYGSSDVDVRMGSGADWVDVMLELGERTISLGLGVDTLGLSLTTSTLARPATAAHVTDFTAGAAGDRIDVSGLIRAITGHYSAGRDPFATGHLSLVGEGDEAVLMFDADGRGPSTQGQAVLVFDNLAPETLTSANFGGFDPQVAVASLLQFDPAGLG